jgi:hypothetical protein
MGLIYICCSLGFGLLAATSCGMEKVPTEDTRVQKIKAFATGMVDPGFKAGVTMAVIWPVAVMLAVSHLPRVHFTKVICFFSIVLKLKMVSSVL